MFNETQNFTKRILFIGIPDMAYLCLDGLQMSGVNIVGVIGPKKNHQTYENFKNFVAQKGLNFIEYDSLKDSDFIEKIKNLNPDIAIVCSFNYKIPKILLDTVKGGFINVHPSLLPKYRGANPYSAAIISGDTETGVTLHFMDENFDTGDIILQKKIPLSPFETMGTIFNRTNVLAFNMLLEVLSHYEKSPLPRRSQPEGDFKKCEIFGDGLFYIDYKESAKNIERFIRALNPFIVATTNFRQNIVKVYASEIVDKYTHEEPGTIVKVKKNRFYVATGDGLIAPTALQFGSFFIGTSEDFIKILNPKEGEMFL